MLTINNKSFRALISGLTTKWRTTSQGSGVVTAQDVLTATLKPDNTGKGLNRVSVLMTTPNYSSATGSPVLSGTKQARVDFIIPSTADSDSNSEFLEQVKATLANPNIADLIVNLVPPEVSDVPIP